jgi:predicted metal-dependent hydrolase
MTISVNSEREVIVSVPLRTPLRIVQEFVERRAEWIRERLAASTPSPTPRVYQSGECLPYQGHSLELVLATHGSRRPVVRLDGDRVVVTTPAHLPESERQSVIERVLTRWFGQRAAELLDARTKYWAAVTALEPRRVLIRNQRRRWASCSADGTLRFNWRLVMAPPDLVDYVVIHELAHLRVPNHSRAFWQEVERFVPDHRARRARLRALGPALSL